MDKHEKIGCALLTAAVLLPLAIWIGYEIASARRMAEYSAQRALLVEAGRLLDEHYRQHGRYPDSLEGLKFTYPDGGDEETLAGMRYETDGAHFTITARSVWNGEELREERQSENAR